MLARFCRFSVMVALALAVVGVAARAQQPFPTQSARPAAPAPKPAAPAPAPAVAPAAQKPADNAPTAAMLGAPVYPSAVYITSYDAGRGQRFYLFGSVVPYAEMVSYYKTVLKQKGEELYESPPTHQFEIAKFKDDTMAFVPGVTVKDFTYGGGAGFPNPRGKDPERFPTVVQIVPAPQGAPKN